MQTVRSINNRYLLKACIALCIITIYLLTHTLQAKAFYVIGTTKGEEENVDQTVDKTAFQWDKAYLDIENKLQEAGADLSDYRHLGLSTSIVKDARIRGEILDSLKKYIAQNSWRQEAVWAQYYLALLTDERVRLELTPTLLEMDNGQARWLGAREYETLEKRCPKFKDMDAVLYRHVKYLIDYGARNEAKPLVERFLSRYPASEYKEVLKYYQALIELHQGNYAEAYRLFTALAGKEGLVSQATISYHSAWSLMEVCKKVEWQLESQPNMEKIGKLIIAAAAADPSLKDDCTALYDRACKSMVEAIHPASDTDSLLQRRYTLQALRRRTPNEPLAKVIDDNISECREKTAQEYRRQGDAAYNAVKGLAPKSSAYKHYTSAINENPDMEEAGYVHYRLGMCRISLRQFGQAVESLRKAVGLDPQAQYADEAQYNIGFTLGTEMKRYIEAVSELKKVAVNYPGSTYAPEALYHIGFYSQLTGDDRTAIWAYSRTAKLYRDSIRAASAEEQVKLIIEDRTNRLRKKGFPEEEIKRDIALSLNREG